jgi:tetratricopeptide (TPR) repeat protein
MNKVVVAILVLLGLAVVAVSALFWQRERNFERRLEEARQTVGTRQGSEACHELVQSYPDSAEAQFLYARQLRIDQKVNQALASLKQAGELGWPHLQIERELLLLRAHSEFTQVEADLQARLNTDPDDTEALTALAEGWSRRGNVKKAESLLNSLLEREPPDAFALYLRGRIRLEKGSPHEALPDLEKAVQIGDGKLFVPEARLTLANCVLNVGDFDHALQLFHECEVSDPPNPAVTLGIARCHWYLGKWSEAEKAFQAVLALDAGNVDALSQLAYIYEERGELERAAGLLERAIQEDPKWYDLHFRMAKILLALGRPEQAADHRRRAEVMERHWAKPRDRTLIGGNPYTGERQSLLRQKSSP